MTLAYSVASPYGTAASPPIIVPGRFYGGSDLAFTSLFIFDRDPNSPWAGHSRFKKYKIIEYPDNVPSNPDGTRSADYGDPLWSGGDFSAEAGATCVVAGNFFSSTGYTNVDPGPDSLFFYNPNGRTAFYRNNPDSSGGGPVFSLAAQGVVPALQGYTIVVAGHFAPRVQNVDGVNTALFFFRPESGTPGQPDFVGEQGVFYRWNAKCEQLRRTPEDHSGRQRPYPLHDRSE
jgi:hypothetical protein